MWCEGLWCESVCMRLWVRGIAGGQPGVMLRSGGGVVAGAGDESGVGVEADEGEAGEPRNTQGDVKLRGLRW